jgi:hypothetical protein
VWKLVVREPGDPASDQPSRVLVCIGKARSRSR